MPLDVDMKWTMYPQTNRSCLKYTHTSSWIANDLEKATLWHARATVIELSIYSDSPFQKTFPGVGNSVRIQNTRMCYAILYSESKTSNKCKRVFKKWGCRGLQSCRSEKTAYPAKCSVLTVCICQCTVYTCLVALLNGEDSAVRVAVLYCSLTEGRMHRYT